MRNKSFLTIFIFLGFIFVGYSPVYAVTGSVCNGSPDGWDFLNGTRPNANVDCNSTDPVDSIGVHHYPYCCQGSLNGSITVDDSSNYVPSNCQDMSGVCTYSPVPGETCTPTAGFPPGKPGRLVINYGNCSTAGACGSAHQVPRLSAPTSGLCSAGSASAVGGNGPWSWSCSGSNGGSPANCIAPVACTYVASVTEWSTCSTATTTSYATEVVWATDYALVDGSSACIALNVPTSRTCPTCAAVDVSYLDWSATSSAVGYGVFENSPWTTPVGTTTALTYVASNTQATDDIRVKSYTYVATVYSPDITSTMTSNADTAGLIDVTTLMSSNAITTGLVDVTVSMTYDAMSTGLTDITPTMTSNTTPSPLQARSSGQLSDTYAPYKAFTDGAWVAPGTSGWVGIDFGNGINKTVIQYGIDMTGAVNNNYAPKNFTFQGSNDGTAWTTLDTRSNETSWPYEERNFVFPNSTGYRHYRVNATTANNSSYLAVGELRMYESSGPIASANTSASTYPAYKAFDDVSSSWLSSATTTGWLTLDLGQNVAKTIRQYSIDMTGANKSYAPKNFTFQGSNDGIAWTTLDTRTNEISWSNNEVRNYAFDNNTAYRHYRINVTDSNGSSVNIGELRMYESSGPIVSASSVYDSTGTYLAYKAFDGASSGWLSASALGVGWLKLDYGQGVTKTIRQYSIDMTGADKAQAPKNFTFQGSNDGTAWTTLDTRSNETTWANNEVRNYAFENTTPYRFYRLNITGSNATNYVGVGELRMYESSGPIVSASSVYDSTGTYLAYKAFDGTTGRWLSSATTTGWLRFDLGQGVSKIVRKYTVGMAGSGAGNAPKNFTFQGSNDGTAWTTLDTRSNEISWSNNEVRNYAFDNTTAYRQYRLNITASNNSVITIGEIMMYEVESENIPSYSSGYISPVSRLDVLACPSLSVSCSGNPTSVLVGNSVVWTASASGGQGGGYTYTWSGTDGLSGSGVSTSIAYATTGAKTASVLVSDGNAAINMACSPVTVTSCSGSGCGGGGGGSESGPGFGTPVPYIINTVANGTTTPVVDCLPESIVATTTINTLTYLRASTTPVYVTDVVPATNMIHTSGTNLYIFTTVGVRTVMVGASTCGTVNVLDASGQGIIEN